MPTKTNQPSLQPCHAKMPRPAAAVFAAVVVICLAVIIGVIAALLGIAFIEGAHALHGALVGDAAWRLILPPVVAGIIIAFIGRALPSNTFYGLADMVLLVQHGVAHRLHHNILSALASFTALSGGASVGIYGPVAHLGGFLGGIIRGGLPHATAVACGVAAAIAATFHAPITGLVFAHEVVLRRTSLQSFTPVAIGAVVGYSLSKDILNRPAFLAAESMVSFHPSAVFLFALLGVLLGALARAYLYGIFWVAGKTHKIPLIYRLPTAGLAAGLLAAWIPDIAGGDNHLLKTVISGMPNDNVWFLLIAKIAATILCLGVGFAGGIVSPTLVIGALLGLAIFEHAGSLINALPVSIPLSALALCCMMAFTAPTLGAPLSGTLFIMELSGSYSVTIAAVIIIAVAVQVSAKLGGHSYYDEQLFRRGYRIGDANSTRQNP